MTVPAMGPGLTGRGICWTARPRRTVKGGNRKTPGLWQEGRQKVQLRNVCVEATLPFSAIAQRFK